MEDGCPRVSLPFMSYTCTRLMVSSMQKFDSRQSLPRSKGGLLADDECSPADHFTRRRELIKLEVAEIKITTEKRGRLLKSALSGTGHPSSGLSRSHPSLKVPAVYLQNTDRASLLSLGTNGLSVISPLAIVHASLSRLWDTKDNVTRSRILGRAYSRKMASDDANPTVGPSVTELKRRSCPPVEVNWYSAKRRSCLPSSSRVGAGSEGMSNLC